MIISPIVSREVGVLAGNPRLYWGRTALAAFAVLTVLEGFHLMGRSSGAWPNGQGSFATLSLVGILLAIGASFITADCISSERREGTLGLLFLGTMKSGQVIFGKLAALGFAALLGLLGFAPVLMVPLIEGGVTGGEVARMTLALVNLMFLALTAGMLVSVYAGSQFDALLRVLAMLGFLWGVPWFVGLVGHGLFGISFAWLNPLGAVMTANDAAFGKSAWHFWIALGWGHLEAWALLFAAIHALERNWPRMFEPRAERRTAPESRRLIGAPREPAAGGARRRRTFAPVARAVLRLPKQIELARVAALISIGGSIWHSFAMAQLSSVWAALGVAMVFSLASSSLFAFLAGRFLFEARRNGELELLLVTPVGARGILREQQLALLRMFRGPLYMILAGAVPSAVCAIRVFQGDEIAGLIFAVSQLVNTGCGIVAVSLVAMSFASRATSTFGLIGSAVGLVELLPSALLCVATLVLGGFGGLTAYWPLLMSLGLGLKNIGFIAWAAARLRSEYRTHRRRVGTGGAWSQSAPPTGHLPGPQPQAAP